MSRLQRFAYAQTRIQASHACFPGDAEWQRLEAITHTEHLLDRLRNSPLRPWVSSLNARMDAHQVERILRAHWREHIETVALWQPPEWRAAVQWTKQLADTTVLQHLLEHSVIAEWIRSDPALRPFALDDPDRRIRALRESAYAPMIQTWRGEPRHLISGWHRRWRALWPRTSAGERQALEWLAGRLHEQHEVLASGELHDSRAARQRLLTGLLPEFRQRTFQPAAAFLHLAITAIHLERLRGVLLRLLLFGGERVA
ncbi:hypothetical protein [Thiohalomonas denitrificans]|uniref:Uncharacterized protein n=1 Tax=Thiohalomonas denitrificans TaxID=415747 RepID=A0A1G5PL77_9GAMM|nr:hypothetical protein [Thiohalomonas denitrificans]SCZ50208.1 hypothetical protein SAMN03097708_00363 [Thiohalomonas denitrificans]